MPLAVRSLHLYYPSALRAGMSGEELFRATTDAAHLDLVKAGDPAALQTMASDVARRVLATLGSDHVIIPCPRSDERRPYYGDALFSAGCRVFRGLRRHTPMESSRLRRQQGVPAWTAEQHAASIRVDGLVFALPRETPIILFDDVITDGNTMEGSALALRRAGFGRVVSGLAYFRTVK